MLKPNRGFSLVELMIAIAIFGILVMLAMPSFSAWIRNLQLRNAAESFHSGLQLARMEAMKRNTRVSFWLVSLSDPNVMDDSCALSASGISWVVSLSDPDGSCATAPSETTAPRIVQAHPGGAGNLNVVVTGRNMTENSSAYCVAFNGLGQVAACSDGSDSIEQIQVTAAVDTTGTRPMDIRITNSGATRMCYPDADLPDGDPRKC